MDSGDDLNSSLELLKLPSKSKPMLNVKFSQRANSLEHIISKVDTSQTTAYIPTKIKVKVAPVG